MTRSCRAARFHMKIEANKIWSEKLIPPSISASIIKNKTKVRHNWYYLVAGRQWEFSLNSVRCHQKVSSPTLRRECRNCIQHLTFSENSLLSLLNRALFGPSSSMTLANRVSRFRNHTCESVISSASARPLSLNGSAPPKVKRTRSHAAKQNYVARYSEKSSLVYI